MDTYRTTEILPSEKRRWLESLLDYCLLVSLCLISVVAIDINLDFRHMGGSPDFYPLFSKLGSGDFFELMNLEMDNVGIGQLLSCVSLFMLYRYFYFHYRKNLDPYALALSAIFSVIQILAYSLISSGDFSFVLGTFNQFLVACLVYLGLLIFWYVVLSLGFHFLFELVENCRDQATRELRASALLGALVPGYILVWLILGALFLPGALPTDGTHQLLQGLGIKPLGLHHPPPLLISFFPSSTGSAIF